VGSVYPVPPAPVNYFPYIFLGYLAVGVIRVITLHVRAPERLKQIRDEIDSHHVSSDVFAMETPQK